jgi:6-phosphogluconolactonase
MLEVYPSARTAADAAAEAIVSRLAPAGSKRLLVTGGGSPGPVYDLLAGADLDWSRVTVAISDERFVDPTAPDSNERQVRERLLRDHAGQAAFVPLKGQGPTPDDDARAAEPAIRALVPFDAVLLGMGEDGHIASLFPGAPGLAETLDPRGERFVIGVATAGLPPYVPRISLTARALFDAKLILLLIAGAPKKEVLERIKVDAAFAPPAAALLRQTQTPVRVLWSPGV